jgi:predicted RNA-binding Zn-ribbon protein involved in translation (DUF1610 family)
MSVEAAAESLSESLESAGITGVQQTRMLERYEDEDALVDAFRSGVDFTDHDGIGKTTSTRLHAYLEDEYPDAHRTRIENNEGICTTFTTDHGLEDPPEDAFVWAYVCPRCGSTNPLKGDPSGFGGRPFACDDCRWVSLLYGEDVQAFRDEYYSETEAEA